MGNIGAVTRSAHTSTHQPHVPEGIKPPLVLTALLIAVASFQLNATMLAPAVGSMAAELHTTLSTIGLSTTVFLFVAGLAGVFLPPYSDLIGRRRALIGSITIMAIGSLISVVAVNVPMLMVGRAMQGFCGATISLSILILRDMLTAQKFGKYIGILTAINSGVGGVDTLAGGIIADTIGFRGIFALTLILEVAAIALIRLWVPESATQTGRKMDWLGAILLSAMLLAINAGLTLAFSVGGWTTPVTWTCFGTGAVLAVAFAVAETRVKDPLIPLPLLKERRVWGILATTFLTMASSFAVLIFVIPSWALDPSSGFGLDGTTTALLYLMPFSLLGWAVAPLAGYFAPKIGYRLILRAGLIGSFLLILGQVFGQHDKWALFALVFLMGVTYSAASATALNGLAVLYAPESNRGLLPGLNSTMFNLGASIGIGIMASLVGAGAAAGNTAGGFNQALVAAAVLAAIACGFSFILPSQQGPEKI